MNAPPTKREDTSYERHGTAIDDPYLWLEDESGAVDDWVDAQNEHAEAYLESLEVREKLRPEFESVLRTTDYGSIAAAPTGYFQEIETADDEQPVLTHRPSLADERETLVDPNEFTRDGTASMGWWSVSPDGERLAYARNEGGDEQYDVTILSVESGEVLEELPDLGRARPPAWVEDGIYYVRTGSPEDGEQLQKSIHYHEFGSDLETDDRLCEIDEPSTWPVLETDREGTHLLVALVTGWERSDLYYLAVGDDELTPVITETEHRYTPLLHEDTAYLRTNHDAPYYRVLSLDLSGEVGEVDPGDLEEVVPEREGILKGATLTGDSLVAQYERNAVSELEVFDLEGGHEGSVSLPGLGTVAGLSGNPDEPEAFFTYQSFDQPPAVYRYDLESGEREELARSEPGVDLELTVEQVWYHSADGTEVPMFVVHRADLERDGSNPTLLYGYGGFEISQTPGFSATRAAFLRSGGVYAQANLRGGGEFGTEWHEAARHDRKQRTFDDMIAAAEHLIDEGYTSSGRLAIQGGSNGGLTVGVVLTQRPDLVRAVCCHVPLLDMLRFHTLLLGESWTSEYGSPEDPDAFDWIYEYSPYHNLEARDYPAVLFKTAEGDTRVHPVHAWKTAARLQHLNTSTEPILCATNRDTGHGVGKPTWMIVEEALDTWSFLFDRLGLEYVEP
ncbi:prolyl oligopeptidase family serine peptidase [Natrononativus amylolyticus]|uniref:prolyl oligopeptidase family serine peptidase n=1 Tax=Natrononativus amylolyticus TaxID=2963434 RepID=UPI0020CD8FB3|nr:prolyl oligopeptidase family serine peptidase [Natrononativus amylolyticus]